MENHEKYLLAVARADEAYRVKRQDRINAIVNAWRHGCGKTEIARMIGKTPEGVRIILITAGEPTSRRG